VAEVAPVPPAEPTAPPSVTAGPSADPGPTPSRRPASPTPSGMGTPVPSPTPAQASPEPVARTPQPTASRPAATRPGTRPASRVDPQWLDHVVARTGVPRRALEAYAGATLTLQREKAACQLGWNTLAAIGQIESRHGSFGGSRLGDDGVVSPKVLGPALDGNGFASIPDTDGGLLDGDTQWDRAVGPMQFIPATWKSYGADGNGDGVNDPHNIDDAALAAARYLCARGGMDSAGGWRSAVIGYNRSEQYIADVAQVANDYAQKVAD
ncbi:MAG TPA: transglycosylase SLT domain-containing protein, partial [Propionibacterium sp.]|nr:transglycosylase SLT domain-containing protein [Propionibacterium sp.]